MHKVIHKLRERFKEKEVILQNLVEENKDLFMQLDIEKAKFHHLLKIQENEEFETIKLQEEVAKLEENASKEKERHKFYKDLIH